jgi:hypothetical protein
LPTTLIFIRRPNRRISYERQGVVRATARMIPALAPWFAFATQIGPAIRFEP